MFLKLSLLFKIYCNNNKGLKISFKYPLENSLTGWYHISTPLAIQSLKLIRNICLTSSFFWYVLIPIGIIMHINKTIKIIVEVKKIKTDLSFRDSPRWLRLPTYTENPIIDTINPATNKKHGPSKGKGLTYNVFISSFALENFLSTSCENCSKLPPIIRFRSSLFLQQAESNSITPPNPIVFSLQIIILLPSSLEFVAPIVSSGLKLFVLRYSTSERKLHLLVNRIDVFWLFSKTNVRK